MTQACELVTAQSEPVHRPSMDRERRLHLGHVPSSHRLVLYQAMLVPQ